MRTEQQKIHHGVMRETDRRDARFRARRQLKDLLLSVSGLISNINYIWPSFLELYVKATPVAKYN